MRQRMEMSQGKVGDKTAQFNKAKTVTNWKNCGDNK